MLVGGGSAASEGRSAHCRPAVGQQGGAARAQLAQEHRRPAGGSKEEVEEEETGGDHQQALKWSRATREN